MCDFRLPSQSRWELCSAGSLHCIITQKSVVLIKSAVLKGWKWFERVSSIKHRTSWHIYFCQYNFSLSIYFTYTEKEQLHLHSASTISTWYRSMEATSSIPSTFLPSFHFNFVMCSHTRKKNYLVLGHPTGLLPLTSNPNVFLGILFPFRIQKLFSKFSINLFPLYLPFYVVMTSCSLAGQYQERASFWKPVPDREEGSSEISLPTYWTTLLYPGRPQLESSALQAPLTLCMPMSELIIFYILFTHQQIHFLLNLEKFKFTWKYT